MLPANKNALAITYAIRDIVLPARELEKKGAKVIRLNIGDPNKFDFETPAHMREALAKTSEADNGYTPSEGDAGLRREITSYQKRKNGIEPELEDVLVTTGVSESILFLFGAALSQGDNVLLAGPAYPPYTSYAAFMGAKAASYRTLEGEGWQPDVDDIRKKINGKTRALVVINPNNPTGALYPKKILREICDIAGEHKLFLISDEIYDLLTYDEKHISPSSLAKDIPMVLLNGFSKVYLCPGWRVGYSVFIDPTSQLGDIKEAFNRQARTRLCPNAPCQRACKAALTGPMGFLEDAKKKLKERRDYAYKRFNEIDGISTAKPGGAFYIFPKIENCKDDKKFVLDLLNQQHVLFVHGSGFCPVYGKGHFRSVFLPPIEEMEKAFSALETFVNRHA